MGTRSTYRIIEQTKVRNGKIKETPLVLVYFQYDGYPSGHPSQTAEWLASGRVVNGFGASDELQFNGVGCLAAQLIAKYKDGVGNVYLQHLSSRGKCWEDYLYDIIVKENNTIEFVAYANDETPRELFRGEPKDFVKFSEKESV